MKTLCCSSILFALWFSSFPRPATAGDFGLQIEKAVKVSFQTESGKFYQLQSSPSVVPSVWTTQGSTVQGDGFKHDAGFLTGSILQSIFRVQEFDLTNGLVAYYPFNGSADDESGNGNNGVVNAASLTSDRFGNLCKAYGFDGTNSYIELPSSSAFDSENYTVSLWFNAARLPDSSDHEHEAAMLISRGRSNFEIHLGAPAFVDTGIRFLPRLFNANTGQQFDALSAGVQSNIWTHLVAIYQNSNHTARVFLNGTELVLNHSTGPDAATDSLPARLGMRYDGSVPFQGSLDSVRIYNRVLSDAEVQALLNLQE